MSMFTFPSHQKQKSFEGTEEERRKTRLNIIAALNRLLFYL
jgi:hypothetical protein